MPHEVNILRVMPLFIARVTVGRLKPVSSASCGMVADSRRRRYPLTARKFERRTEEISDFSCIRLSAPLAFNNTSLLIIRIIVRLVNS